jgi:hypothetical protein
MDTKYKISIQIIWPEPSQKVTTSEKQPICKLRTRRRQKWQNFIIVFLSDFFSPWGGGNDKFKLVASAL